MAVRSGKKVKFKFVWTKELIFLIIGLVALITATVLLALPSDQKKIYNKYTEAGASLESDHVFESISYSKLTKKISTQDSEDVFYVFFGSIECTNCVSEIQTINQSAKDFEIENVYYFDAAFIDAQENKDDAEWLLEIDAKEVALGGVDLLSYPSLWVFKGGKLVYNTDELKVNEDSTNIEGTWKLAAYKVFSTKW